MRRTLIVVCVFLAGTVLAVMLFSGSMIWDGSYTLTISIDKQDDPPSAVACYATPNRSRADAICAKSPHVANFDQEGNSAVAQPYYGQALQLMIYTSGRTFMFCNVERYQERFLVVISEWADGRRVCMVVDIPDGREAREIRVPLP